MHVVFTARPRCHIASFGPCERNAEFAVCQKMCAAREPLGVPVKSSSRPVHLRAHRAPGGPRSDVQCHAHRARSCGLRVQASAPKIQCRLAAAARNSLRALQDRSRSLRAFRRQVASMSAAGWLAATVPIQPLSCSGTRGRAPLRVNRLLRSFSSNLSRRNTSRCRGPKLAVSGYGGPSPPTAQEGARWWNHFELDGLNRAMAQGEPG